MAADLFKSGTPAQIAEFSLKHPEFSKSLQDQIGYRNDATKQNLIDTGRRVMMNPSNAESILSERVEFLKGQGADPTDTMEMIEEFKRVGPEGFANQTEMMMAFTDPQGYQALKSTRPDPDAQLNRDIKQAELDYKRAQIIAQRAKGKPSEAKAQEALVKAQQKLNETQTKTQDSVFTANQNINAINSLLTNEDYVDKLTGWESNAADILPTISATTKEAENLLDNIKNNLTIESLGVMSGPLTDSDIKIIASAASRLSKGMSKEKLREELNLIKTTYNRLKDNYQKQAQQEGFDVNISEGLSQPRETYTPNQSQIDLVAKYSNMPTQ
jgi:hypothetical protein